MMGVGSGSMELLRRLNVLLCGGRYMECDEVIESLLCAAELDCAVAMLVLRFTAPARGELRRWVELRDCLCDVVGMGPMIGLMDGGAGVSSGGVGSSGSGGGGGRVV